MILLSWNIRGLGAKVKRSSIRKLIGKQDPHMVFIQETKLEKICPKILRSIWNDSDIESHFSPSQGSSGGLLSLWKKCFFDLVEAKCERNWIMLTGKIIALDFKCSFVNLYNPCDLNDRAQVWIELAQACFSSGSPCLIIGDFNEVLESSERGSQIVSTNGIHAFKSFVQVLELIEISPSNGKFTWFRGQSKSKLDRMFIHSHWLDLFPSIQVSLLKRALSDHCPILVQSQSMNWGPRPFRFIDAWLSHLGCVKLISKTWSESCGSSFMDKLKKVKLSLKKWNAEEFGCIDEKIQLLENKIQELDLIADNRNLEAHEFEERRNSQMDLWRWLKGKEVFWVQQSRAKWIKEGDRNTRYFHVMATMRRRKNAIESLTIEKKGLTLRKK